MNQSETKRMFFNILRTWILILFFGCNGIQTSFNSKVEIDFLKQPLQESRVLTKLDIQNLPSPVQNYLLYTGVVGKPQVQNMRIVFDELMYQSPNTKPMDASSEQYNFFNHPSRYFFMKASKMGVPFRVLHSYSEEKAIMIVRVASLFNAVDLEGENLSETETVTVLNDLCLFAPGALIHKNIRWAPVDKLSAKVIFKNGKYQVSAMLYFNELGELIKFVSEDRSALQDDGSLRKARWTTPVRDYKEFNGIKLPTYGEAIWNYPEGDYIYGKFFLKTVEYNLKGLI
ncbi:hypothetical protein EHQ68_08315 [Leptospira congkakensis]|uniref:Lipoprotein n=1 Tax=Leptospira congkakensis TaxID=2484932 RepID=A0A4Z1AIM7_9LEPT|nr:DUF6544 family protein [Leptospira congkakensis]TGL88634.1 hypothetical protein EHQ69_14385 [Leptospira congkakensis]TGL89220.1 hypothetical protein EHQ68_08315 [Leptospira congkakensis]TGL97188.1 hypothetical protein EHQ70_07810 [Leptospira congkakensis]